MVKGRLSSDSEVMGVDPGSDAVDTLLHAYEGRMRDMYTQAANEMARSRRRP